MEWFGDHLCPSRSLLLEKEVAVVLSLLSPSGHLRFLSWVNAMLSHQTMWWPIKLNQESPLFCRLFFCFILPNWVTVAWDNCQFRNKNSRNGQPARKMNGTESNWLLDQPHKLHCWILNRQSVWSKTLNDSVQKAPTQLKDPNSHDSCPRKQFLQKADKRAW